MKIDQIFDCGCWEFDEERMVIYYKKDDSIWMSEKSYKSVNFCPFCGKKSVYVNYSPTYSDITRWMT